MNACFSVTFAATIATPRVQAGLANLMRSVALIHKLAADRAKTPVGFFNRSLSS